MGRSSHDRAGGILTHIAFLGLVPADAAGQVYTGTNSQSLVELSSPFNLQLIQDKGFAKLWVEGASKFEEMDPVERYQFKSLLTWWLILQENIYYQHEEDLVDDTAYKPWDKDLETFVRIMNLKDHWPGLKDSFQKSFAGHVSDLIASSEKHP